MTDQPSRHDCAQRSTHVGDRQLSTLMDEVRRLTARVRELETALLSFVSDDDPYGRRARDVLKRKDGAK